MSSLVSFTVLSHKKENPNFRKDVFILTREVNIIKHAFIASTWWICIYYSSDDQKITVEMKILLIFIYTWLTFASTIHIHFQKARISGLCSMNQPLWKKKKKKVN